MKTLNCTLLFLVFFTSHLAKAGEDIKHFPALDAPDISTALCNLRDYNKKLVVITSKQELSAEDMVKVHELTYTLENALMKLNAELNEAAVKLEEVHKASERLDAQTINRSGGEYLEISGEMFGGGKCD